MRARTDDELMRAAAGGDRAAFAALAARHRAWVCALVAAVVGDPDRAEDVTQEVFCRLHRRADRYAAQGQFTAWLKRVALNAAKDALRQRRRPGPASLGDCGHLPADDPRSDPAAALESGLLHEALRAAVAALPGDQRQALVLHYFGGQSVANIARTMRCPVGTVKTRLFHARRRVRLALTDHWEGDDTP